MQDDRIEFGVEFAEGLALTGVENGQTHDRVNRVVANHNIIIGEFAIFGRLGWVAEVNIEYVSFRVVNDEEGLFG